MKKALGVFSLLAVLGGLVLGCATAPTHPSLKDARLSRLIPVRHFFANIESSFGYRISPDGSRLGWLAVKDARLAIHYKTIGRDAVKAIEHQSKRSIYSFSWAQDSRKMFYVQDREGDENFHIYLADTDHPDQPPIDLTPFSNTKAWIHRIIRTDPAHILVEHNQRDKTVFDLYKVHLTTHKQNLIAQNPGDVVRWITDEEGVLRGRIRKYGPEEHAFELLEPRDGKWNKVMSWGLEDVVGGFRFTSDGKGMWLLTNRGRDRIVLVRLDLESGDETLIYEDGAVDIGKVLFSHLTKEPVIAVSYPDYQRLHFFDPEMEADMALFQKEDQMGLAFSKPDDRERLFIISAYTDKGFDYYLFNRDTRKKVLLKTSPISVYADSLATMKPIAFQSRDGLTINGYLALPKGSSGKKLPMVLHVHGGPWARYYWGYSDTVQFLANRGYAVLQINFRGSTGYGRMFKEAAVGEFAGKMHTDLIDGVTWAVAQGIADPKKIAIFGASYGGYATLVGLTFTPDVFACGVDIFGISNLVTWSEAIPKYWKHAKPFFKKYIGDPNDPEDRRIMKAKSPLFQVDRIKRPLLIVQGANDVRVKRQESEQMVEALRKSGKEVTYIFFEDEGHSIRNWKNRLFFYRKLEDFLAKHLGGRSAGFDYYELGRYIF